MSETIVSLIKQNLSIPKKLIKHIKIGGDRNYWYRTLSAFFTVDEKL